MVPGLRTAAGPLLAEGERMATRTVRFYEITDVGGARFTNAAATSGWLTDLEAELEANPGRVFTTSRGDYHSRVWPADDMMSISIWRDSDDVSEVVNRQTGTYSDLTLGEDELLSESSHAVFFEDNVVGFVRHNHGPYPGRLAQYITEILKLDPPVDLTPLLFTETYHRFQTDVDYAREVSLRLPAHAEGSMPNGPFRQIFRRAHERYGEVDVTLTIQVNAGLRGDNNEEGSLAAQQDLANLLSSSAAQHLEKAQLKYRSADTERAEMIDFLKDRIGMKADIEIEGLSPSGARVPVRDAIREAYDALKPDIDDALGQ